MRLTVCFIVGGLLAVPTTAQVERLGNLPDRAVDWVQEYIQIDTINPPGNEIDGARFLAGIFEAEGIPYEMAESAAGRGLSLIHI